MNSSLILSLVGVSRNHFDTATANFSDTGGLHCSGTITPYLLSNISFNCVTSVISSSIALLISVFIVSYVSFLDPVICLSYHHKNTMILPHCPFQSHPNPGRNPLSGHFIGGVLHPLKCYHHYHSHHWCHPNAGYTRELSLVFCQFLSGPLSPIKAFSSGYILC